ncbi:putative copper export protein [Hydrogenophaga sp. T4]|nr:putative copper export protein [Hydrogenophaga sp. T4]
MVRMDPVAGANALRCGMELRQATALILLLLLLGRGPLIARFGERVVDVVLLIPALLINAAAVFTGHGAATEPLWLAGVGHVVHLLAAGVWAGGLPALAYGLHMAAGGRDPLFRKMFLGVVRRFSVLATVCVALIVASGALIAYLQFGARPAGPRGQTTSSAV